MQWHKSGMKLKVFRLHIVLDTDWTAENKVSAKHRHENQQKRVYYKPLFQHSQAQSHVMFRKALRRTLHHRDSSSERSKDENAKPKRDAEIQHSNSTPECLLKTEEIEKGVPGGRGESTTELRPRSRNSVTVSGDLREGPFSEQPTVEGGPENIVIDLTLTESNAASRDIAISALKLASEEFTVNYEKYQAKNQQFLNLNDEINSVILIADAGKEIFFSATVFKQHISKVLEVTTRKEEFSKARWPNKVGAFLVSLYPVVRIAIGVVTTAAEV